MGNFLLNSFRPVDRGYIVNWGAQQDIWSHAISHILQVDPKSCVLLVTEPMNNFSSLRESMDQVVLDDLGFRGYYCCPAPCLAFYHARHLLTSGAIPCTPTQRTAAQAGCGLILDCGFSFCHAAPFFDGRLMEDNARRVNIGGRALSNHFKELISFRSINLMEEGYLVEQIMTKICFFSQDFQGDLQKAKAVGSSPFRVSWVLPDGLGSNNIGYQFGGPDDPRVAQQAQQASPAEEMKNNTVGQNRPDPTAILNVNNERFSVPEVVFSPADIGMEQAGISEAVMQSIEACPGSIRGLLWSNIVVVGGLAKYPGIQARLEKELRSLAPDDCEVRVFMPEDPVNFAWQGGSLMVNQGDFARRMISKASIPPIKEGSNRVREFDF